MRGRPASGDGRLGARARCGARLRLVVLGTVLLTAAPTLAACSSSGTGGAGTPSTAGVAQAGVNTPTAPPSAPAPVLTVAGGPNIAYGKPVRLAVAGGSFTSVQVTTSTGSVPLDGQVAADGTSWTSEETPRPGTTYTVTATVKNTTGQDRPATAEFAVKAVPADKKLAFTVQPQADATVGIAQPIVVQFLTPITEKAAVEKRMLVDVRSPSGAPVVGSWHWLSSRQVDWRPKTFWTPGTKVTLEMRLAGVKGAADRYGRKDYTQTFTIGDARVLKVDLATLKARLFHGDTLVATWPTGGGRRGLATYSGTYVVLNKSPVVQMDSCSARITCDKKDPDYYDEKEFWATRLTASGTFVHAADWDRQLGSANVSHGCLHLSGKNAKAFYDQARPGDPVVVTNSGRGPQERIDTQDPGLYDWNLSWQAWAAGSALS